MDDELHVMQHGTQVGTSTVAAFLFTCETVSGPATGTDVAKTRKTMTAEVTRRMRTTFKFLVLR